MKSAMDKGLRKKIEAFYCKHGRRGAEQRLRNKGLSLSFIQKVLAGTYPHQPVGLQLMALNEALESK